MRNKLLTERSPATNTGLVSGGLMCKLGALRFYETLCSETRLRQAAKRYTAF